MTMLDQQHDTDQQRDTRYAIISRLGKGGEGVVYLAQDRQSGKYVAMKEARKDYLNHERSMLLRIHEKTSIHGIPRLLDTLYHNTANTAYMSLVIDYIEGRCMENIPYLSLPLLTVTSYITQFFRIIDALHRQWFVHYDLHDGNILCGNNGYISVVDFGLAWHLEPHQVERIHYEIETMLMIVRDWLVNPYRSAMTAPVRIRYSSGLTKCQRSCDAATIVAIIRNRRLQPVLSSSYLNGRPSCARRCNSSSHSNDE